MPKYYNAKEDADGIYVSANHTRYSVSETDPADVYIPASRQGEMIAYDSIEDFLPTIGLESVEEHEFPVAPPEPVVVPQEIANWRARAVLEIAGLLPKVEAALASLTGDAGVVARAAWNGGSEIHRHGPTVAAAIAALGLTDAQVDEMFRQGAALHV